MIYVHGLHLCIAHYPNHGTKVQTFFEICNRDFPICNIIQELKFIGLAAVLNYRGARAPIKTMAAERPIFF